MMKHFISSRLHHMMKYLEMGKERKKFVSPIRHSTRREVRGRESNSGPSDVWCCCRGRYRCAIAALPLDTMKNLD